MRKLENSELDRLNVEEFKQVEKTPICIVLDNVRSLNNIGSVFRTADAFLIEKIYLCGITATPPHKEIHKTALGATDSVAWEYRKNTLVLLDGLKIVNSSLENCYVNGLPNAEIAGKVIGVRNRSHSYEQMQPFKGSDYDFIKLEMNSYIGNPR